MNKKKIVTLGLTLMLGASTFSTVLANDENQADIQSGLDVLDSVNVQTESSFNDRLVDLEKDGYSFGQMRERMKEKGTRQIRERVSQEQGFCEEDRLQQLAEEKGLNVEEMKEQLQSHRAEMEQLRQQRRAQMDQLREEKLVELAEKLDVSIEELSEMRQGKRGKGFYANN